MYYVSYYIHKSHYKSYQTSSRKRKYQLVAKDGLFERHAYIKKHINISIAQKEEGPNLPFMLIIIMAWNLGKSLVIIIIIIEACQLAASLHVSNNSIPAMSPPARARWSTRSSARRRPVLAGFGLVRRTVGPNSKNTPKEKIHKIR